VATEIFVESLPAVAPDDESWDDSGLWTPNDAYRLEPPELEGDDFPDGTPDGSVIRQPCYQESLAADGITLMPISGGAPEPAPFVPSEADWADYREWTEWVDRLDSLRDDNGE
jgi:hypothetical protein